MNTQIVPFYIYVLDYNILISSPIIPRSITDTKNILFSETSIPGLDYSPYHSGGFGNRKISFSLDVIKKDTINGNSLLLKLYEILRNPVSNIEQVFQKTTQFTQNPKVLFNYGIGSIPLVWYVTKCELTHESTSTNAVGNPCISSVDIELTLDETDKTNDIEKVFRQFSILAGSYQSNLQTIGNSVGLRQF